MSGKVLRVQINPVYYFAADVE